MTDEAFVPLSEFREYPVAEMKRRAEAFYAEMRRRRTVREFSDRVVDRGVIEDCVRTAGTAPSGANQQPWTFVVVSDPAVKRRIREGAEEAEKRFYTKASTETWREALEHLGTVPSKPFLETAPYLIAIFSQRYNLGPNAEKIKHYYPTESIGIATGMLITALHHAGLATLTYTPADMRFLNKILARPENERAFMIVVAGYPAEGARVPAIEKKPLEEISVFV